MKLTLSCPHAEYGQDMMIYCRKAYSPCSFQRFKPCKGWCVLTPGANTCLLRKDETHGENDKATANGRHKI